MRIIIVHESPPIDLYLKWPVSFTRRANKASQLPVMHGNLMEPLMMSSFFFLSLEKLKINER